MEVYPLNLFTNGQLNQLFANWKANTIPVKKFPIAYFINPYYEHEWLISHINYENTDLAFGIVDLKGNGQFLREINLRVLVEDSLKSTHDHLRKPNCLIADYGTFKGTKPISEYYEESKKAGRLITHDAGHKAILDKIARGASVEEFPGFDLNL